MISIFKDVELQVVDAAIQDSELDSDVLGTNCGEERAVHRRWNVQQDDNEDGPHGNCCVSEDEVHALHSSGNTKKAITYWVRTYRAL
jgi:hypothetical protein